MAILAIRKVSIMNIIHVKGVISGNSYFEHLKIGAVFKQTSPQFEDIYLKISDTGAFNLTVDRVDVIYSDTIVYQLDVELRILN